MRVNDTRDRQWH